MSKVENRDADILRTTEALAPMVRAKYLSDRIGPKTPFFNEILLRAVTSGMSPRAFQQLFVFLTFADRDGTSAFPKHETIAAIVGDSVRTSERATNELAELGWVSSQQTRRGPAIRAVMIGREKPPAPNKKPPRPKGEAIEGEVLEPTKMAVLNDDGSKFLNRQICRSRTAKNGGLPITTDLSAASHRQDGSCLRSDGEKEKRQLDAIAQPQAATYRSARRRRGEVRPW